MGKEYDSKNENLELARAEFKSMVPSSMLDDAMEQLDELGRGEYERGRLSMLPSSDLFSGELPVATGPMAVELGIFRKLKNEQSRLQHVEALGLTYTDSLVLAAVLIARRELVARTPLGVPRNITKFGIDLDPKLVKQALGSMASKAKRKASKKPLAKKTKAKRKPKR